MTDYPKKAYLTFSEAVEVWQRHWQGEFQHHIAAHFGVNPARVNEVLKEHKHAGSRDAALRGNAA
ncbi:MAG: hypothetical protein ACK4NO_03950 [Glycocaulis sp.]